MIESVPFFAPTSPPETGASMLATPRFAAASAISTASDGWLVVMSTSTSPDFAAGQRAVVAEDHFAHIVRKADDREHHVATRPPRRAANRPSWRRARRASSAFDFVRLKTVTW